MRGGCAQPDAHRRPALGTPVSAEARQRRLREAGAVDGRLRRRRCRQPVRAGDDDGACSGGRGVSGRRAAYRMDWNNVAPSVGVAWQPRLAGGWLSRIAGADPVLRGGYSLSYTRNGLGELNLFSNNPGPIRNVARSLTAGTPTLGHDGLPVLLRDTSRLAASAYPAAPAYPLHTGGLGVGCRRGSGAEDALCAPVQRWLAARARSFGCTRGSVCREHVARAVDGLRSEQLRKPVSDRERFSGRVPERAAQPPGQHRGRPGKHVRLHGRPGHLPVAHLPRPFRRGAARRREESGPGQLHLAQLPEGRVGTGSSRCTTRTSPRRRRPTRTASRTRPSRRTREPRGCLRTSGWRTPMWRRAEPFCSRTAGRRGTTPSRLRCGNG